MCVPLGGLFVFSFSALFGIIIDVVNQGIHNEVSMERNTWTDIQCFWQTMKRK